MPVTRPQGPTSWLLDGRVGFRSGADIDNVFDGGLSGLSLAARTDGPLALNADDGSLGRLALPRGMAFDRAGRLHLLRPETGQILRFEGNAPRAAQQFVPLTGIGGVGEGIGCFLRPQNIAFAGNCLYVADLGNLRVQVFDTARCSLVYVWTSGMAESSLFSRQADQPWMPMDVASAGDAVYILDGQSARVYRHELGRDWPCELIQGPRTARNQWCRLAVDRRGNIYILEQRGDGPVLVVYDHEGFRVKIRDPATNRMTDRKVVDAAQVRADFDPPPIMLDHRERFCLPASLAAPCPRVTDVPPVENPLALCQCGDDRGANSRADSCGLLFDHRGCPVRDYDPSEPQGPPLYQRTGTWFSRKLDSQLTRCRWHRIILECPPLPAGTSLHVLTYSDEVKRPPGFVARQKRQRWDLASQIQADLGSRGMRTGNLNGTSSSGDDRHEFLVHGEPGRYLWLRVELRGDGFASPHVRSLRVHYPRQSYLDDLPAVYQQDEESRRFLDRFLSAFQTEWDGIEGTLANFAKYFDTAAVPADSGGRFVRFLSGWLGIDWEGEWDVEQNRQLLEAVPAAYRSSSGHNRRGTLQSLRGFVQAYLQNMAGLTPQQQNRFPVITEGFRERRFLTAAMNSSLDSGTLPLWSRGVVNRLQLDVHSRVGDVRLVSTGDPLRDVFHEHAHRFRVFVPAVWVQTADDERMLRRAIEQEKPAHTQYELNLVQPGIQIGVQATLGVDTIVSGPQTLTLATARDTDAPPSRPARLRLGVNTMLGTEPTTEPCGPESEHPILGINSILRPKPDPPRTTNLPPEE